MPPKASASSSGSGSGPGPGSSSNTEEQNTRIFNANLEKIELEKQLIQDQINVAASEAKLRSDLLREESQARINAMGTPKPSGGGDKEDNTIDEGEIPQEVRVHSARFAGLPQDELVRIFNGKFKPVSLYKQEHRLRICTE